jgi:ABC-type Mn2+/Zn2+ transport system permease subunit
LLLGGLPASLPIGLAILSKQVVLSGSALLGGIFLGAAGALFFKSADVQIILWLFLAGAIGGFINGAVFLRYLKPNDTPQSDALRRLA